jgi:hypothetical protein
MTDLEYCSLDFTPLIIDYLFVSLVGVLVNYTDGYYEWCMEFLVSYYIDALFIDCLGEPRPLAGW